MKKEKTSLYIFEVTIWLYPGEKAAWHFVTIPKKQSADIKKKFKDFSRGWGSLPVVASIGNTKWNTSIFPDNKAGTYLLPLKKEVRRKEGLQRGDSVKVTLGVRP